MQDLICIFGFEERLDYWNLFSLFTLAGIQTIQNYYSKKLTYILLSNSNNLTRKNQISIANKSILHLLFITKFLTFQFFLSSYFFYLFMIYLFLKHVFELNQGP